MPKRTLAVAAIGVLLVALAALLAYACKPSEPPAQRSSEYTTPVKAEETTTSAVEHTTQETTQEATVLPDTAGPMKTPYAATVSCYDPTPGALTASGERYDPYDFTAAHPFYGFGTRLLIGYRGRSVVVRITDRGDYFDPVRGVHRWDLSEAACQQVGLWNAAGVDTVDVTIL